MNSESKLLDLLQIIEDKTRGSMAVDRVTKRIGPFLAAAHPTNAMIWLSCALAFSRERGQGDPAACVEELRAFFKEHHRRLRFEILEPLWPELAPALMSRGVELQGRMPLMLCWPGQLRKIALPAGMVLHRLNADSSDELIDRYAQTGLRAFGERVLEQTPQQIAELRRNYQTGRYRSVYVCIDGEIAGIGTMSAGTDELVGIGTLPEFRRRGIAAAISAALVAEHFARGAKLAWLSAGDEIALKTYEKIGFEVVGDQVNLMDPA
jgi:GNAT superfamily N-acetyltransferase